MFGILCLIYCLPLAVYVGLILIKKARRPFLRWSDILAEIPLFNWAIALGAALIVLAALVMDVR